MKHPTSLHRLAFILHIDVGLVARAVLGWKSSFPATRQNQEVVRHLLRHAPDATRLKKQARYVHMREMSFKSHVRPKGELP